MKSESYLLDTNICVFYLRGKYHIDEHIDQVGWDNCFISEITALELKMGAELSLRKRAIDRSEELNLFLSDINILPINNVLDVAAHEKIRLQLSGTPCVDNFSTAIVNDMICVTDNVKDFHRFSNIRIQNWIVR